MAYYNGTAQNLEELKNALVTSCSNHGWTYNSTEKTLAKGSCNFLLRPATISNCDCLALNAVGTPDNRRTFCGLCMFQGNMNYVPMNFPSLWHCFVFEHEVYFWCEVDTAYWQWLAFGESHLAGLPAPAPWYGGTVSKTYMGSSYYYQVRDDTCGGELFPHGNYFRGSMVWDPFANAWSYQGIGADKLLPLRELACSVWNAQPIFLPLREFVPRSDKKISLAVDLEHARHARLDYNMPGDVITLGNTRWMLLPWYHKSPFIPTDKDDLFDEEETGKYMFSTGPYGIAIRYEGP